MDIEKHAEVASGVDEPHAQRTAMLIDRATSLSAQAIRSSPPLPPAVVATDIIAEDIMDQDTKSDSEAETVLLPGVDGYSPPKIRKTIKVEDKPADKLILGDVDDVNLGPSAAVSERSSESATSSLGKRKRSKHGNGKHESRNGNSSGLSSVPTSPVAATRSSLTKTVESDYDPSKSPSSEFTRSNHAKVVRRNSHRDSDNEKPSADEKERSAVRRRRNSTLDRADKHDHNNGQQHTSLGVSRKITRSRSPHVNIHRRSASSNSGVNSFSHKKKRVPAPLRATKEQHSIDERSDDDSSDGESPAPRRSRTRQLATPPTGNTSGGLAKMPPHRKKNPFGRTELTDACAEGDIQRVKWLLEENPQDLDVADAAGNTPLQCASLDGHVELVKLLLEAGCNIHCINKAKESPLLDAVENGHLEVVKLLLEAGVNPRVRNQEGAEPIEKIKDTDENAEEIRRVLRDAKLNSKWTQVPASATVPEHSPYEDGFGSRSRRTQSHGRSTKTGDNQLYTSFDTKTLRSAAAKGDLQTVSNILQVLALGHFDDPESLVVAARGGHDEVVGLLLGIGDLDPDPPALKSKDSEHATPMLAAIGSDNINIIEMLLGKIDEGRFDPTRRWNGKTYYEIARERKGPLWEEEARILKDAYDKYVPKSGRSTGSTSRGHQKKLSDSSAKSKSQDIEASGPGPKREQKGVPPGSPQTLKRGPGRPRKEGNEASLSANRDLEAPAVHRDKSQPRKQAPESAAGASDTEPAKPRRKLMSAKELQDREKQRRGSINSVQSSGSVGVDAHINESANDRARSVKREDSKDRMSAIRGDSPAKRQRSSTTPPPSPRDPSHTKGADQGTANKRRRLDSERRLSTSESRRSPAAERKVSSATSGSSSEVKSARQDKATESQNKPAESRINRADSGDRSGPTNKDATTMEAKNGSSKSDKARGDAQREGAASDAIAAEKKTATDHKKARQSSSDITAKNKRDAEEEQHRRVEQARAEQLAAEQRVRDEEARKERERREELERLEQLKREEEQRREDEMKREEEQKRQKELEAQRELDRQKEIERQKDADRLKELERQKEEERQKIREMERQKEIERQREIERQVEIERQEELRRQEEIRREEARKFYEEQRRLQREEEERRKAARREEALAEQRRREQEREAARLAKLPALLRWFDAHPLPASPDFVSQFSTLQGVRYDTIRPEATGRPEGRDQWLLNTHVALLLGERDLQLSRYTAWERTPATELAKRSLWKIEADRYAMLTPELWAHNSVLQTVDTSNGKQALYAMMNKLRMEALSLFLGLDLFFVKVCLVLSETNKLSANYMQVSDFMFIVPKFLHLRNLRLCVHYRELHPDPSWLDKFTFPAKWKTDPDAEANYGFAPGNKIYMNGALVDEDHPKMAQTSKTPFPEQRVPRIGLRQVLPHEPEYEKICEQQGLYHLLPHRQRSTGINGLVMSLNAQIGITPPESMNGEMRGPSEDSPVMGNTTSTSLPNGITSHEAEH